MAALGIPNLGSGGRGQDDFFKNAGELPMLDKPEDIAAKSDAQAVRGERGDKGEETYIEIKAPSGLGSKSSTPYKKVLPKYQRQAEDALNKKQIPKKHQQRVKEYFDSINK